MENILTIKQAIRDCKRAGFKLYAYDLQSCGNRLTVGYKMEILTALIDGGYVSPVYKFIM